MKRFALLLVAPVLAIGLEVVPAHAVVVASCGGSSVVIGHSCSVSFGSDGFGYFINLKPGAAFTGRLTAAATYPGTGFSVTGYYISGQLVGGSDSLLHDLAPAGTWKLTVTASTPSLGRWGGTIEAGPF
ncbi:MAG: hypothetical protein ACYDCC_07690 [Actinomycetota bacterium]